MYKTIFLTHQVVVVLFLVIYLIKTTLLLTNSTESLAKFSKTFKVPEMIVSFLFLLTGGYMLTQLPEINSFMIIKLIAVFSSIPLAVIGFKKSNKALASIAMLLIIGAYGLAEMSKKHGTKSESGATTSVDGREIYAANCAKCHGDDGKLGAIGAADLSLSSLDKTAAAEVIRKGKSSMSGFEEQLSEGQIEAVVDYITTLHN